MAWWESEVRKDIAGGDSWLPTLGLLRGTYKRIGWLPGEREAFDAWRAKAMGLNNPNPGDTL